MQVYNFDDELVTVLKNFSTLNPSLQFRKGDSVSTLSSSRTIFATYKLKQPLELDFAIYSLNKFLSVLSAMGSGQVHLEEDHLTVVNGKNKARVVYAEPAVLETVPTKSISLDDLEETIQLFVSKNTLDTIRRMHSILEVPNIVFEGDGTDMILSAVDVQNEGDQYREIVGKTNEVFKVVFKAGNLPLIPQDYTVDVGKGEIPLARFSAGDLEYFVAHEAESTFG